MTNVLLAVLLMTLSQVAVGDIPRCLKVNRKHIYRQSDLTVSWQDVQDAAPADMVDLVLLHGQYDEEDIQKYKPQNALVVSRYINRKAAIDGELVLKAVPNLRKSYVFRYLAQDLSVLCVSDVIDVQAHMPLQGRLSLTGNPSEMRVMWVSNNTDTPMVIYGLSPGAMNQVAKGTSSTYTKKDLLCDPTSEDTASRNWIDPGMIHDVVLTGLKPNQFYFYKYGTAKSGFSDMSQFRSPPRTSTNSSFDFLLFGDLGVDSDALFGWSEPLARMTLSNMMRAAQLGEYSFALNLGDVAYAVGHANRWDEYFLQMEPFSRTVPTMVAVGNHEYDNLLQDFQPYWGNYGSDSGGECGVPFAQRFNMPWPNKRNFWYSFEIGNVHFLIISTEQNFLPGSEQAKFIEKDLQSVDRKITPWVIVAGHRPMYTSVDEAPQIWTGAGIRRALEDVFIKYEVDVMLWAHVHRYERTCRVNTFLCTEMTDNDNGIVHLNLGVGGQFRSSSDWQRQPNWSVVRVDDHGFVSAYVDGTNSITFEFWGNGESATQPDGSPDKAVLRDQFKLTKTKTSKRV